MIHDAVVIITPTDNGKKSGVFVPCDKPKEARELAKYLNDRLREAEASLNGQSPSPEVVVPFEPEADDERRVTLE